MAAHYFIEELIVIRFILKRRHDNGYGCVSESLETLDVNVPELEAVLIQRCEKDGSAIPRSPQRETKRSRLGLAVDGRLHAQQGRVVSKGESSLPTPHGEGIYVASRVKHAPIWLDYRDRKRWPIVSTWIDEAGDGETADFGELWQRIRAEIWRSKVLVFYADGNEDFPFKGALVEVGMALAMGKPVFAVLDRVMIEGRTMRPVGSWLRDRNVRKFELLPQAMEAALQLTPIAKSETRGSDETGWLIENAERLYLTTDATGFFAWTKDNLDAIRFCRRQDAEKVASGNDDAWHVVEHMWSDPAPIEKMNVNTEKRGKP
jgi:hypothetical protein